MDELGIPIRAVLWATVALHQESPSPLDDYVLTSAHLSHIKILWAYSELPLKPKVGIASGSVRLPTN